jgi:hypothetical protein
MLRARVLFFGDRNYCDFADPIAFLERSCEVVYADEIPAACRCVCAEPVDLIVAAAGWPGDRSHAEFEALRQAAPFTPILTLLGAWCEGEERTGKPWPGAIRLYAEQFIPRLTAELTEGLLDSSGRSFSFCSPPFTKTHEDRLLSDQPTYGRFERIRVAIHTASRSAAGALADALAGFGITPVLLSRDTQFRQGEIGAIVWDCPAGLHADAPRIKVWQARTEGTPLILLLGFPRTEDCELARGLGAAATISKPFLLQDLICAIDQKTPRPQTDSDGAQRTSAGSSQSPRSATSIRTISRFHAGS